MEEFKEFIKNRIEAQKEIGDGGEKVVYPHPDKDEKVVGIYKIEAEFKFERSPEFNKAKFYFTKILHMLFPKNVPDVFMTTTQPRTITKEKIKFKSRETISIREEKIEDLYTLRKQLKDCGIEFDESTQNFVEDNDGNMVYLDDFYPWNDESQKAYNHDQIRLLIMTKLTGLERDRALNYLNRLKKLYLELKNKE
ncbi:MAG: hypothetical protein A2915_01250 [Candidatus Yanofskybacteria bacterium RIFCSPLOWO2_01_FULL_41_34]|uniref:Uncharacterized protein n=1 Tax=Candidatus Yanofskybacteria bacterium RIFCSPHIGHO2_01_FULL_41_26 TaxID=1802661 RepID=A0A1F8EBS3_9BACT|nr:MAG: hypothetical protein A2649_01730 [Candidatus Yanofskybacteria bacterium RIFCSPHIGHO2_01_FULL_41_26]OGN21862.1 MAG: hypothetical protein A2915_01250 [Candidatus Yanofskybacteria bacterium RIFCSPLOWO2_01_FULL_41_34]